MSKATKRIILVTVAHLVLVEVCIRLSVNWRESTGERWGAFLFVITLAAVIWAVLPAFSRIRSLDKRAWFRIGAMVVLFFGLLTTDYFWFWHLRPNLGLHEEPKWWAECPQFRRKIQDNLWKSPDEKVEPTSQ